MTTRHLLLLSAGLLLFAAGDSPLPADDTPAPPANTIVVKPTPDLATTLHNPATGWMLYVETMNGTAFPDAKSYWHEADPFVPQASILYIRCNWAQIEPSEGHFAWDEDANFRALVDGAAQRHLKLAFRIVTNSKDSHDPATPNWVHAAGAAGYTEKGQGGRDLWTPSVKDPVFRKKLEAFVAAFAQKFDDPARVDFIDGCGLGWWGEIDHIDITAQQAPEVLEWICGTYGNAFHHVLLGMQLNSQLTDYGEHDDIPLQKYGYVARRDALGSSWLSDRDRSELTAIYPKTPFFGESCYFSIDNWPIWKSEKRGFQTVHDVLQATYDDALTYHANTLDLRSPHDAGVWTREAPDLVAGFAANGGYRLFPTSITFPATFPPNEAVPIRHTWKNLGVGVMANDNPRWNHRYRVAFALLDPATGKVAATAIDPDADPGTWETGETPEQVLNATFAPAPAPGAYELADALVNTQAGNQPEIQLATKDLKLRDGWSVLGEVRVTAASATNP